MKTALISVYYKDGVADFAKGLVDLGYRIVSTGGTKAHLEENGIDVVDVKDITNFPEILDGRVKTLAPQVFAGILYKRDDKDHVKTVEDHEIDSIDMVVNILYPFEETVKNPESTEADIIEKIDIGGPSMIRAAAKNYKDVCVVTDASQYDEVLDAIKNDKADLAFRKKLAKAAFTETASYDMAISKYFQGDNIEDYFMHFTNPTELRYGENSHQKGYYYDDKSDEHLAGMKIYQGKKLSFNNLQDITAAMDFIRNFDEATCIGIKHNNPSGISSNEDIVKAYDQAIAADSESIFGGIIVLNREVGKELAEKMTSFFLEIIIAPSYTEEAIEIFKRKPNLRVLEYKTEKTYDVNFKQAYGGLLVQELDEDLYEELEVVTDRKPSEEEMKELLFAYKCVKCVKSNGIAVTKNHQSLGLGLGDVNRFFAVSHALDMAGDKAKGAVAASDAFFPFDDGVRAFDEAGIKAVIQPGGSIKDQDSIDYCNEHGMAMVFTKMRHFRH